jgi:hypothetical protein
MLPTSVDLLLRLAALALICCAAASSCWAQEARDATRLEVGERFCFGDRDCLAAVRLEVSVGRPIQWVIYSLLQSLYDDDPRNAERAYEFATRAMAFSSDFLSEGEWNAGQTTYAGAGSITLRQVLVRYALACENRISWLGKYHCLEHALLPLLPGQYNPELVPIEPMPQQ